MQPHVGELCVVLASSIPTGSHFHPLIGPSFILHVCNQTSIYLGLPMALQDAGMCFSWGLSLP